MTGGRRRHAQPLARDERRQHQLGDVLGQRRNRRENQRGRSAEKHGRRQRLSLLLRDGVVKAAALPDLPVHPRRLAVVHLQPVHAEVVALAGGMLRVDERQRDKRAAVFGPAREDRQPIERRRLDDVQDRSGAAALQANAERRLRDVARAPQLGGRRGHDCLGELHEPLDEREGARAERHLGPSPGAEQVRGQRKRAVPDVREEQRRAAGRDHATMNLGGLLVGVDWRVDGDEVAVAAKLVEERAEVGKQGLYGGLRLLAKLRDDIVLRLRHRLDREPGAFASHHHVLEAGRLLQLFERDDARKARGELHGPRCTTSACPACSRDRSSGGPS